ncbi:carbohydrate ABC transporter permease [Meiothermus granaticius]|uniref:L-arabinose transport system permease protein AraQ n=1 Tax=Meiothermus granaticius NBRC 107808 TaxID=1227551 RepID=A0A399FAH8_9DEIN|nr:carbohydrate ABC transporter permease [Meiothermus granaticius]RIH92706.1 L-arabinose transport system permease protein AraQ [Meiothermus granaticius NBRC 107808]GEM87759.1 ABC transporter permease [Meiothermus granaticius NBRC 107808]
MTHSRALSRPRAARPPARSSWRDLPALLLALPYLVIAGFTLLAAFTPTAELNRGELGGFTLENFRTAWASADFPRLYWNTLLFTFGLLLAQVVTVTMAGFALAHLKTRGRNAWFYLILVQLFLPPSTLILPNFLIIQRLGLADTLTALVLPYVASATGAFLLRQGFLQIPRELIEAARVDGATSGQILWRILLPMVRPQLAAFALVSLVYHWNEFLWPLVVLQSTDKRVLSLGFASFARSAESGMEWGLIAAGAVLVALPMVAAFAFFQRNFVEAFARSGLKG